MFTEELQSLLSEPEIVFENELVHLDSGKVADGGNLELSAQQSLLSSLKVPVGMRVEGLQLSVKDILSINSKQVFALEVDPSKEISLWVDDEKIAKAQFVLCGDELSLEISEVLFKA